MGMFDSFYDANGDEWQTKAFGNALERWQLGDKISASPVDFQVEIFGGPFEGEWVDSFATIRGERVAAVHAERDPSLPLLDYNGIWRSNPSRGNNRPGGGDE